MNKLLKTAETCPSAFDVKTLGQVFTPAEVVNKMLSLRKNFGRVLEPSCGAGAFFNAIPNCVGIEIDSNHCPKNAYNMDFFDYPISEKFDTIIGNPPYVSFQDISESTKSKLDMQLFNSRANLYLFFIEKCIRHLTSHGELIFIVPRDFLKSTSSSRLNEFIYNSGTITDLIETGDGNIFGDYAPNSNCVIFRFEKDNFERKTSDDLNFIYNSGQLYFTKSDYKLKFSDVFYVKVGAASGADNIFESSEYGNMDFVCSYTQKTGKLKRMIYNEYIPYLDSYKEQLINRKFKKFDESNWWMYGRNLYVSDEKRVYVNYKTRTQNPFFINSCNNYDGSIFGIFPKNQNVDIKEVCDALNNEVDWNELGFLSGGRFLFSHVGLTNCLLPNSFERFI